MLHMSSFIQIGQPEQLSSKEKEKLFRINTISVYWQLTLYVLEAFKHIDI